MRVYPKNRRASEGRREDEIFYHSGRGLRGVRACAPRWRNPSTRRKSSPKKKPKPAKVKPAPVAAKTDLPCPRAKWKDDPVCFGENDPSALPLPSAQSTPAKEGSTRAGDITLSPKARVNQDLPQPVYGNNPNPNPSTSQFGGGLGVDFHF